MTETVRLSTEDQKTLELTKAARTAHVKAVTEGLNRDDARSFYNIALVEADRAQRAYEEADNALRAHLYGGEVEEIAPVDCDFTECEEDGSDHG